MKSEFFSREQKSNNFRIENSVWMDPNFFFLFFLFDKFFFLIMNPFFLFPRSFGLKTVKQITILHCWGHQSNLYQY